MNNDFNYKEASNTISLLSIPDKKQIENSLSRCHICLEYKELTDEHIPPKNAYNDYNRLWEHLNLKRYKNSSVLTRGGLTVKTICNNCNTKIGSVYASEYIKFIKFITETTNLLLNMKEAKHINCHFNTLFIAKEITIMILASEPIEFSLHYEQLRKFVLDKNEKISPPFTILAFLVKDNPTAGTISRFHARVASYAPGFEFTGGEISNYPFGVIYCNNIGKGYNLERFTDITKWFSEEQISDVSLYTRLTGIESSQCLINGRKRKKPQIDYFFRTK